MKKLLHVSKYYYPFRGGTEQIAQDCVSALSGNYEQKVFAFNHESGDLTDYVDGVEVVRAGGLAKISSQTISLSYGKLLKKTLDSFDPDVVIFHYPNPFGAHYLLKYMKKKTKLVIYWHLDIVKQVVLKQFFIVQNRKLIERADKIIATSPNYIEGSRWLQSVKEKCVVVPNCINVERFANTSKVDEIVNRIKDENEGKIICLAVGRHTEYKGFRYLIEASKFLDDRFVVYITGKGELTKKLKQQAANDKKVVFLGQVSDEELVAYMKSMDIFCFSSITKNEAFGLALAEGMYFAKPAVTFTIEGSGVNYVSINGTTGEQVPNKDVKAYAEAMIKLADNPALREQYGNRAKKRVENMFLNSTFHENIRREIAYVIKPGL